MAQNKKKKLIVFCDGTWNTPDEKDPQGKFCPTNVSKLFRATCSEDASGTPQIVHYTQGVGTRWDEHVGGGAFGWGISDNIKDGYRFICSNYKPGDEIFLFGFSRGAYTARSLAGLIYNVGILKREHFDQLNKAYEGYRDRSEAWHPNPARGYEAKKFRDAYTHGGEKIHFLGVWDTVGALGAPYGLVLGWLIDKFFKCRFHDVKLSPIIESGYHALSRDEKRWPYRPTLWKLSASHDQTKFEEEWFPGVHSDVGGGYADSGLADIALQWMTEKAAHHGMKADLASLDNPPVSLAVRPLADRPMHDAQKPYYRWATLLLVKWPARLFVDWPGKVFTRWPETLYGALNRYKILAEADIAQKIANIQPNGDYNRC